MSRVVAAREASHIVSYRGMVADGVCHLGGRVLRRPLPGGPREEDGWWQNLLNTYRRLDSEFIAGASVNISFRGSAPITLTTDADGYYHGVFPVPEGCGNLLWENAEVTRTEGGTVFQQPILCVPPTARLGVISDIDDTVLESSITHWQTAAKLTFLRNARTRKPLEGVAKLYQAFQRGVGGGAPNPIFYVSASPWNLYDLLEDFFDLNEIPQGPILLRELRFDRASFASETAARAKLEHVETLVQRYPALQWVLMGDSGQVDADLYAQLVRKFPGRIVAVYIRDVDPSLDSKRDQFVDGFIGSIADTRVPMLRVANSIAIAEHARSIGLIEAEQIARVAAEVVKDQARPPLLQAAVTGVGAKPA